MLRVAFVDDERGPKSSDTEKETNRAEPGIPGNGRTWHPAASHGSIRT
jgi:hypothetical protein